MFSRIIHFFKYNNAAVFILLGIFLVASGVFAQSEAGQELIGEKKTSVTGEDNALLLAIDPETFDMDFKISRIEKDETHYFVLYTYLDVVKKDGVWQYEMSEKERRVPLTIEKDLSAFLAEEFAELFRVRQKELIEKKEEAMASGEQKKQEVSEYSGLIGQTLDIAARVFPGFEAIQKTDIPSPSLPALASLPVDSETAARPDNLTQVYEDYISSFDPDQDDVFGSSDNCPADANSDQADTDGDGKGDACDLDLPSSEVADPSVSPGTDQSQAEESAPADISSPETGSVAPLGADEVSGGLDPEAEVEIIDLEMINEEVYE
jgi:hypothetical protein